MVISGGVGDFFWHMICDSSGVARKFYSPTPVRSSAENAAMNLRLAAFHLAKMRVPPPLKTIQPLRRRLSFTLIPHLAQVVKIRHSIQNVGSQVSETRPIQTLPV